MQLSDRVGRRMKLRDLHVLMTVVQAGSMGKAAQRLNTGQPAVSRSIAHLEHTLGVRLLDRDRRGVELTPYGRALLDCGRRLCLSTRHPRWTRCGGAGLEEAAKTISNAPDQVAAVDYRVKSFLRVIAVANGMDRAPLT